LEAYIEDTHMFSEEASFSDDGVLQATIWTSNVR